MQKKLGKDEKIEMRALEIMRGINLPYHNIEHVIKVYESARNLCKNEGISEADTRLVLIAVLFHDTGFLVRPDGGNHEAASAHIANTSMDSLRYMDTEIIQVKKLIMATKFPHNPKTLLEKIVCDADLAIVGSDGFWEQNENLRKERGIENIHEWIEQQLKFMEEHTYFTKSADNVFGEKKRKHVFEMRLKLQKGG
ncbi:MAG: HD domain-containing protein [Candidatus Micrarchaeota archaeon]|nr:HD domain-containing protein [Candidatus Micrarchaeota archaeon]